MVGLGAMGISLYKVHSYSGFSSFLLLYQKAFLQIKLFLFSRLWRLM